MDLDGRNPVFRFCDQVRFNSNCSATQISLEYYNFAHKKLICSAFHNANNKGSGQTAQMDRLAYAFVARMRQSGDFSQRGQYEDETAILQP